VSFRVGGTFVYPPPALDREECKRIDRVVFVAGGVGINPIMSMISAMHEAGANRLGGMTMEVSVLYSARLEKNAETNKEEDILFATRLAQIANHWKHHEQVNFRYTQFITGGTPEESADRSEARLSFPAAIKVC
jgi:ferredoxin-NADP reductase